MTVDTVPQRTTFSVNNGEAAPDVKASFSPGAGEMWYLDQMTQTTISASGTAATSITTDAHISSTSFSDATMSPITVSPPFQSTGINTENIITNLGSGASVAIDRYINENMKIMIVLTDNEDNNDAANIETIIDARRVI